MKTVYVEDWAYVYLTVLVVAEDGDSSSWWRCDNSFLVQKLIEQTNKTFLGQRRNQPWNYTLGTQTCITKKIEVWHHFLPQINKDVKLIVECNA